VEFRLTFIDLIHCHFPGFASDRLSSMLLAGRGIVRLALIEVMCAPNSVHDWPKATKFRVSEINGGRRHALSPINHSSVTNFSFH